MVESHWMIGFVRFLFVIGILLGLFDPFSVSSTISSRRDHFDVLRCCLCESWCLLRWLRISLFVWTCCIRCFSRFEILSWVACSCVLLLLMLANAVFIAWAVETVADEIFFWIHFNFEYLWRLRVSYFSSIEIP